MDVERIIGEIEQLQEMFEAPDVRPLSASDISAANRRHDEMLAHSPWFRFGSILVSAAEMKLKAGFGFRASAAFPVLSRMAGIGGLAD
jgi:hypothetical protein